MARVEITIAPAAASVAALVLAAVMPPCTPAAAASRDSAPLRTSVPCPDRSGRPFPLNLATEDDGVPPEFAAPWLEIDFAAEPERYLWTVLESALVDGVLPWSEPGWWKREDAAGNPWYHVPWLDWGPYGRECRNGLTRERSARPGELHDRQLRRVQNWGVAMYNAPGGRALARVWPGPLPRPEAAKFERGSVAIKLLFTEADTREVPHLDGAPVWRAMINAKESDPGSPRVERPLLLVQIDLAVHDARAAVTGGWVFGSFAYHARRHEAMLSAVPADERPKCLDQPRSEPVATMTAAEEGGAAPITCHGLVPIGLMWGDDDGVAWRELDRGRKRLQETRILTDRVGLPRYLGWGGRLNGPVDSGLSSCFQCHRIAEFPRRRDMTPSPVWLFEARMPEVEVGKGIDAKPLHLSLQLGLSLENFCNAGEEDGWGEGWPEGGRELCGPHLEVQEEFEKLRSRSRSTEIASRSGTEEPAESRARTAVLRETDVEALERLRAMERRQARTEGLRFASLVALGAVLVAGCSGYGALRIRRWRRRRHGR